MGCMPPLSENEKNELLRLIEAGRPMPEKGRGRLFPGAGRTVEIGKEYLLETRGR